MAENRGDQVTGVTAAFLSLAWLAVALRCYVRTRIIQIFGLDDWFAVLALVSLTVYSVFAFLGVHYGNGKHQADLSPHEVSMAFKYLYPILPAYNVTMILIKISVSIFLLRITVRKLYSWIIYSNLAVVLAFNSVVFFISIFQCQPVQYYWTKFEATQGAKGKCLSPTFVEVAGYVSAGISFGSDMVLAVLPAFLMWDLQIKPRAKVAVFFILLLGSLAGIVAIIRIPYTASASSDSDRTWTSTDLFIWAYLEPSIGIIAASAATLRPLFKRFFSKNRLFGNSTPLRNSSPWPGSSSRTGGYIRSRRGEGDGDGKGDVHELDMLTHSIRRDLHGDGTGIKTIIEAAAYHHERVDASGPGQRSLTKNYETTSTKGLVRERGDADGNGSHRGNSGDGDDSGSEDSAMETVWMKSGILKTTEVEMNSQVQSKGGGEEDREWE
ncbi:hypothetical protein K432DRAFT_363110 [Lepidopterella palustris CBS 459.81]|uniref:Rhodopsin domain-containing protein n=1 Tax=Lepidopterella palustris CBS 459.81 TaxID=1314670 RepID=A0A8E2J9V7_9PEZI|nr:hypothetical protein K432DRAFT_363110 [Lepidopterella palustris CBS 459.81]